MIGENFRIALGALRANKMRSILTMLGIIIGVSAVIVLVSIGRGTQASITSRISQLGTNLVFVRPGAAQQGGVRMAQGSAQSLTLEDAEAIADPLNVPSAVGVAPEVSSFGQVVANGLNLNTRIMGVTAAYEQVRNMPVAQGEFISTQNVDANSMVVVLGSNVAENLFPGEDPIGKTVKINQRQFRVIGVLQKKGGTGMGNQDDLILAPITTVMTRLFSQRTSQGGRTVASINVQASSADVISDVKEQITQLLRERHKVRSEDDFNITTQEETLDTLNQVTGVFTMFLGSIAGISLLVGGIGIMNIMLVSVTERTREIGIRKAVGAKRKDVLLQFLVEAITLSLTGGSIGILIGVGVSKIVSRLSLNNQPLQTVVSPDVLILAVSVSLAVGLFFGVYPATRAAALNPIDALRYE